MAIHGYIGNVITANPTAPTVSVATGVWTTEQQLQAIAAGNWPGYEYPVTQSLRFNSADSAYLNRTPASAGNRQTWTWSGWVKRSVLGTDQVFFGAYDNSTQTDAVYAAIGFSSTNTLFFGAWTQNWRITTQVFRDVSAWYHIVIVLDTTQSTASNRVKVYINGSEVTAFGTSNNPTLNADLGINATNQHGLGRINYLTGSGPYYSNVYMTEVNFIDGQALTPSSFGLNDPETGIWSPKRYTGTYGTNGFYVNFSDNSNTTAATLGKDYSGNGNNWTPNNFSVTAGAGNDSMVDSPTNYGTDTGIGGSVRGNYATWNPILKDAAALTATLTNGNLDAAAGATGSLAYSTIGISSGKWYFEYVMTGIPSSGTVFFGICELPYNSTYLRAYRYDGGDYFNGSAWTTYGASFTTNDVIGIAFDLDNQTIEFFKNGTSQGQKTSIGLSGRTVFPLGYANTTPGAFVANFGQRAFAYTAPSGFKALVTTNLPTPTIGATSTTQANKYFDATLYTGTGATQSITNSGSMQPDFVWLKCRSNARDNVLFDAVRGVYLKLYSNLTVAEASDTGSLTAFNSNGFTMGGDSAINASTNTFVGWQWNAGGSTVTNTSGTISAQVRANTTSGFSIVTYTANGTNGATVGHGLGVTPSMMIFKKRSSTGNWIVVPGNSTLFGGSYYLQLNTTSAIISNSDMYTSYPGTGVFYLSTNTDINASGSTYVAYCFAPVAGYSAFGSYTGNGSTDGPFVYTGFRPEFVMIKRTDASNEWLMHDSARSTYNVVNARLSAQSSAAESTSPDALDFISNGVKLRTTDTGWNASGGTYIYMAFAENPFKYSLAR